MVRALRALRELGVSFAGSDVRVLCYHEVRGRERFRAQMSALVDAGYTVATMEVFTAWLRRGRPLPRPAAVLTFDGFYRSQLDHALPVLDALGLSATFFPVASDVEGETGTLRALVASGHTIGCHSVTHPDLTTLAPEALASEVDGAKRWLEDVIGRAVAVFGYPYGLRNARVAEAVRRAGFEVAFTIDLDGVRSDDDPYDVPRLAVLGEPGSRQFAAYLGGRRFVAGGILLGGKLRERVLA